MTTVTPPDVVRDYLGALTERQRRLLTVPEGRRLLTRNDFKLFCFVYFRDVMRSKATDDQVTLSEFHRAFMSDSNRYISSAGPADSRTAWICPRGAGKSTMLELLTIWLAAHGHQQFVAIFSSSPGQAEQRLGNIRNQLNGNDLLRKDYPDLCRPATRRLAELKLSDNKQTIIQSNGFICTGRGIDTSVHGLNILNVRPDVMVLDDIEGGESNYSLNDVAKRLVTLQDDIYPLEINAHVVWIGTTTRPGGLTEQLVHKAVGMKYDPWVDTDNYTVRYFPALLDNPDGSKRSMWPERWSMDYLHEQMKLRSFLKNFMCLPAPEDYDYWQPGDFNTDPAQVETVLKSATRTIIAIDPAVTTKRTSDRTAIAVVSFSPSEKKAVVREAVAVRLPGPELRKIVLDLLVRYRETVGIIYEANMGGDLWKQVFHDMPVPVAPVTAHEKKEVRAATLLDFYQKGYILHAKKLEDLENEMLIFPNGQHDDLPDAVAHAVAALTTIPNAGRSKMKVA